ncbi:MAG: hypothetical protein ACI955_001836 [Zhongshania sp.]|jgi:hypothetical protein
MGATLDVEILKAGADALAFFCIELSPLLA